MVKRTTINLDMELVAQAREVLEAGHTTETVHAALREVVRRDRLRRLAERDWGMTLEDLQEMRRSRIETRPWGKWLDVDGLLTTLREARASREAKEAGVSSKVAPTNAPSATRTC